MLQQMPREEVSRPAVGVWWLGEVLFALDGRFVLFGEVIGALGFCEAG